MNGAGLEAIKTVCLIQPPLMSLNGPYPSLYYLRSFFMARAFRPVVRDHSIGLFERIFCRKGLERIFALARQAEGGEVHGAARYYRARFLSEEDRWLCCIDRLIAFLRGKDREWGHFLALGNGVLPGGPRFDAAVCGDSGRPLSDSLLASKLLADLADFITAAVDPAFALACYAPSLAAPPGAGYGDFAQIERGLEGGIMKAFYRPFLEDEWDSLDVRDERFMLGLTIPFPGCLIGALTAAAQAKRRFGERVIVVAGGGYVNTDLRYLEAVKFFDYVDYLSFDRGYGSLEAILEHCGANCGANCGAEEPLYKTMYRSRISGELIKGPGIDRGDTADDGGIDDDCAVSVFPDYTGVDFSRYLYVVDDTNPMHRLWSDGHWLKAYLAHGCYRHSCAFCDTELDYIRCFRPVDPAALFNHLVSQAAETGIRGVHLVDEAAPASSLLRLAELNRETALEGSRLPLIFWGNIRFDRDFSPDTAALLAAGGLLGVSAGIEVASAGGARLGKGIGLRETVRACAAFKEQGILTHGYLIYGYWDGDGQEIIDSAELVRQLFAEGLLDSAFWHQFILTRHSRLYTEWRRGSHPRLKVREPSVEAGGRFALNDLRFEGSERFDRYTEPLDRLLAAWMAGDTGADTLSGAFPFRVPPPAVSPRAVAALLDEYARDRDTDRACPPGETAERVLFLGSRPVVQTGQGADRGTTLFWRWRQEDHRLRLPVHAGGDCAAKCAAKCAALLERISRHGTSAAAWYGDLTEILGHTGAKQAWKVFRNGGLIRRGMGGGEIF